MNIKEMRVLQHVRSVRTERRLVEMKQSEKSLAHAEGKLSHLKTQLSTAHEDHKSLKREHYAAMFNAPMLKRKLEINASLQEKSRLAIEKKQNSVEQQTTAVSACAEASLLARSNYRGAVKKVEKTKLFLGRLKVLSNKTRAKLEEA